MFLSFITGAGLNRGVAVLKKLTSGRFILTIIDGVVFAYATYAKILEAQAVSAILIFVFTSYFDKNKTGGGKGNGD